MSGVSVLDVGCAQCAAEPGAECAGEGEGYHLSRFDRFADQFIDRPDQEDA